MQVTMLGPLEVRTDDDSGIVLDVGGARLRALLIMLALRPGQLVPASQLIDGLLVAHPMREPLAARLMRGLHAYGLREQALLYGGKPLTVRLPPDQAAVPDEQADALGRLLTALAGQRTLLVLDNCEHLIEAAATLADRILAACPRVRILATSREPLNITGEALWTVDPLTLPPDPAISSDSPERAGVPAPRPAEASPGIDYCASVSLLIQRARAVFPEFSLTGGSRTAMPRHQTLRAVVDWSWDLLDLVTALTDKSLLEVRHGGNGARYPMLEIIRAYGQDKLAEAGERDELRRAHAEYFTRLAEISRDYLLGAHQLVWLRKLSDDQDNLHAALRGIIADGDGQRAVRLVAGLSWYWWLRSLKVEGVELIADAVDLPRGPAVEPDSESLAVVYLLGAMLAMDTPVAGRAGDWFRTAGELAAAIPDPKDHVLRLIGPLSALFGTFHTHRVMQPSVFDDAVADPEPWVSATALVMRGHVGLNLGRQHVAAEEDFLAATGIFSGLGERWGPAIALSGLAMLEGWRGEHAAAADHYRRATEFSAEIGSAEDEVHFRLYLARELWLLGERDDGDLEVARAELTRVTELGGPPDIVLQLRAMCATALGYLAAAGGDLAAARRWHAQALEAARSSVDAPVIAQALTGLADLALREADPDRAELGAVGFEAAYQRGQSVTTDTLAALVPLAQTALRR